MTVGTNSIRNVVLVGHGSAGKTSLVESLAFATGATDRLGSVDDGTTLSDFDPEEQQRGMSINTSLVSLEHNDQRINLLDSPGYADFIGEVIAASAVGDTAMIVVDAGSGVQVGTETAWRLALRRSMPRVVVITRLDRENASWDDALASVQSMLGPQCQPLYLPIGSEADFSAVVGVLDGRAYEGAGKNGTDAPPDAAAAAEALRDGIVERIAESDDDLTLKYLEGEKLTEEEIVNGVKQAIMAGTLVPVVPAAGTLSIGAWPLLRLIEQHLPSPAEAPALPATIDGAEGTIAPDSSGPTVAFVFKTTADEFVGRLSFLRVGSGTLKGDAHLTNTNKGDDERMSNLSHAVGKEFQHADELPAGDIGVVTKLGGTTTFDTLADKGVNTVMTPPQMPSPIFTAAVSPKTKADVDKLGPSLQRLVEEDPTLRLERDQDSGETMLSGLGESHVQLAAERLSRKFKVDVEVNDRRIPYRETVTATAEAEYLHKKQTGGHGQYARVALRVEPRDRGDGFEFTAEIVGGAVPRNYIPAVEKGVIESLPEGSASYPLTDLRVVLYDGKHHDVDSSEMAFKLAASQALKEATSKARPILLEPVMVLGIEVPDASAGDVMSDLNSRRARVLGMEPVADLAGTSVIKAEGPMAEFLRYATDLRSMTGGRGTFSMNFSRYDPVPDHVAQKVRQEAAAEAEAVS